MIINHQLLFEWNMKINLTEDIFEAAATLYFIHLNINCSFPASSPARAAMRNSPPSEYTGL